LNTKYWPCAEIHGLNLSRAHDTAASQRGHQGSGAGLQKHYFHLYASAEPAGGREQAHEKSAKSAHSVGKADNRGRA